MKNLVTILILIALILIATMRTHAQVISRFAWSSSPLTTAAQGPNGTSVSSSAVSTFIGGTLGYAINPGLPTANIDLIVPGTPYFDINSMDISLHFRREESVASFFKRGANFDFGSNGGQLTVRFTTTRGSTPGDTTINSGNIVAIADDHIFHEYRFRYDDNTGVANVYVDGVIVYTFNGVAGNPLSWTGAGNVIIGENMDATSRNIAVLSNLTVQLASSGMLPLNILSFDAVEKSDRAQLTWKLSEEAEVSKYVVERSFDNTHFKIISSTDANMKGSYSSVDDAPYAGTNYYRLRVIDRQGNSTYSAIRQLNFNSAAAQVKCYPNPAVDHVMIDLTNAGTSTLDYSVISLTGITVKTGSAVIQSGNHQLKIDLSKNISPGTYVVRLNNRESNSNQSLVIVKK